MQRVTLLYDLKLKGTIYRIFFLILFQIKVVKVTDKVMGKTSFLSSKRH